MKTKFKVGDKIKVKSFKQMCKEYPGLVDGNKIYTHITFRPEMRKWCGRLAIITRALLDNRFKLNFKNSDGWYFSEDMLIKR